MNDTEKMQRKLINFPSHDLEYLQRTSDQMGLSMPELIRIAIGHWSVCEDGEKGLRHKIANRVLGGTE